jgi:hypothetical protein
MFVKAYENETREHGIINGLKPSRMFLGRLNNNNTRLTRKQQCVTYVDNQKCKTPILVSIIIGFIFQI